jgi:hypothetical protein
MLLLRSAIRDLDADRARERATVLRPKASPSKGEARKEKGRASLPKEARPRGAGIRVRTASKIVRSKEEREEDDSPGWHLAEQS